MSTNVISPHALFFIVVQGGEGEVVFDLLFSYTLSWMDGSWLRKKGWMDEGGYFDFQFWVGFFYLSLLSVFVFVWAEQKRACACGTLVLCTAGAITTIKLCGL
jgi:hypothetical protein